MECTGKKYQSETRRSKSSGSMRHTDEFKSIHQQQSMGSKFSKKLAQGSPSLFSSYNARDLHQYPIRCNPSGRFEILFSLEQPFCRSANLPFLRTTIFCVHYSGRRMHCSKKRCLSGENVKKLLTNTKFTRSGDQQFRRKMRIP